MMRTASLRETPPEVASPAPTLIDVLRLSTTYLCDHGSSSARLDSELLCAQALGLGRLDLYLQFDRPLDEQELTAIRELVRRRGKGEPVAYITGSREFYGRSFTVTRDVLVPRPETETLVERALAVLRVRVDGSEHVAEPARTGGQGQMTELPRTDGQGQMTELPRAGGQAHMAEHASADAPATIAEPARVADLGTGSGCIAITLAAQTPGIEVVATDFSSAALQVARANAQRLDAAVTFVECSWADALSGHFDLIVSNPPYITTAELESVDRDVRDFEPHTALLGGDLGLDAYGALLASVQEHVTAARLLLEVDPRRAAEVGAMYAAAFPGAIVTDVPDLAGRIRVVDVQMP
jgi:release factor glutamine methyltransferase